MSTDYMIEFVQYPIVGGLAGHNFVVQKNSVGQVVSEIHGFAYDEHGTQLFVGTKASDRLRGKEFNHKYYYETEYNRQLVFSGTKEGPSSFRVEPHSQNRWLSSSPVGMWAGCL